MKYFAFTFGLLILCSCSTVEVSDNVHQKTVSQSSMMNSAISQSNSNIRCSTLRDDDNLDKWKPILQKTLEENISVFGIGGECELSNGISWVSALLEEKSGNLESVIVQFGSGGALKKQIKGYSTFFGDHAPCGFKEMIDNRIIVICDSGIKKELISVNTDTDERLILSTDNSGGEAYEKYLNEKDDQN